MAETGRLALLTMERARELKGKNIQTYSPGYAGQDLSSVFCVGEIISEVEYYRHIKEDCFPDKYGHRNRAEYWESILSPVKMEAKRRRLILLKESGGATGIVVGLDGQTFSMGDADRYVWYAEVSDLHPLISEAE